MNKKLESIKPYIKFYLQHAIGQPIKDSDIDVLCNNGEMISIANLGEGYSLVSRITVRKRDELEPAIGSEKLKLEKAKEESERWKKKPRIFGVGLEREGDRE